MAPSPAGGLPQRDALRRAPVRRDGLGGCDDGRIVAVFTGGSRGADGFDRRGPGTRRVVDWPAACSHPASSTRTCTRPGRARADALRPVRGSNREEYLAAIAAYAAAHPDEDWILGGGWAMPAFPGGTPTAADLDRGRADRPVFLPNRDHHGAWVNSRALEIAGIDRDTPDPPDGRIERDADGRPSGMLHEGAMALVSRLLPRTTGEDSTPALLAGQRYLHSLGVTGWQDAIVGAYSGMDDPAPDVHDRGRGRRPDAAGGRARCGGTAGAGVEQIADLVGAADGEDRRRGSGPRASRSCRTASPRTSPPRCSTPYLDRCGHATDNTGLSFVDPDALREAVAALDAAGFQVHVHAIGDRGVREALDAFEGTRPGDATAHHIAHLQLVHPDDVPRFAGLGVAANMQALWACHDDQMVELTIPFLGEERARWQYPFGDLHRAGARLVAGQRLAGQHARPARRDPRRRQPDGVRRARPGRQRAVPARSRRWTWRPPSRRTPPARRG